MVKKRGASAVIAAPAPGARNTRDTNHTASLPPKQAKLPNKLPKLPKLYKEAKMNQQAFPDLLTAAEVERMFHCQPEELHPDMLVRDPYRLVTTDD